MIKVKWLNGYSSCRGCSRTCFSHGQIQPQRTPSNSEEWLDLASLLTACHLLLRYWFPCIRLSTGISGPLVGEKWKAILNQRRMSLLSVPSLAPPGLMRVISHWVLFHWRILTCITLFSILSISGLFPHNELHNHRTDMHHFGQSFWTYITWAHIHKVSRSADLWSGPRCPCHLIPHILDQRCYSDTHYEYGP